jgi:hypothetical protein
MANAEQLKILRQGTKAWNKWMVENPDEHIDLSKADLRGANLIRANLTGADLSKADLIYADLSGADLSKVDLSGAKLMGADLNGANLSWAHLNGADLSKADVFEAYLSGANLTGAYLGGALLIEAYLGGAYLNGADLSKADLSRAVLVETNLERAILASCKIYGVSAWELKLEDATQNDLVITPPDQPAITVDNLEVAQFVYLLLHNEKIRDVIDTIGKKAVLILGRFTPERKAVLDALRIGLRQRGYLPILFDFEKPSTRDFTETIKILAGMSLFVIADISNPRSSPLELQATIPDYMVPFVPIIQVGEEPFSMFRDLHIQYKRWVLAPLIYDSLDGLIRVLDTAIINPALEVHNNLLAEKAAAMPQRHIRDYEA